MVIRYDRSGALGKAKRTPQGGIVVPAGLTRTGVLEYGGPNGSVRREYRADAEVFSEASLETLVHATVTREHPPEMVTAKNFRKYAIGHVSSLPRKDTDGVHVVADVVIQDAAAIKAIEADTDPLREVSCGYSCELDETPGVTPSGERYDARQINIQYNHLALVPRGRAGRNAALRLDAEQNQIPEGIEEETDMKVERIDGVEYQVDTDAHKAAAKRRDEEAGRQAAELAQLRADVEAAQALVDEASASIETAVVARVKLIEQARSVGIESLELSMSEADLQRAIAGKVLPGVDLEGRSSEFLAGAIAAARTTPSGTASEVRADMARKARTDRARKTPGRAERARLEMVKNLRAEGRK